MPPTAAREILQSVFRQIDHEQGGFRNVFLVGHNINSDIRYLEDKMNLDILSIPSIITVIDTQQLARRVFNFPHKYISLKLTMSSLGMIARQLHNSGNDAVYTLKALIYLFCSSQEGAIQESKQWVGTLDRERGTELLWLERIDLLKETGRSFPRRILLREVMRQPKPPRVDNPDLFEVDSGADGQMEDGLITIFGDDA